MATQVTAKTQYVKAANGINFAYRRLGSAEGVPLFTEIHFRGNMDFWDPLLVDNLATKRPVIIFDRAGVGRTDGNVRTTYEEWAKDVVALAEALGYNKIDLLGFSMGGYCAQMVALNAPLLIRKLIIAGSGPSQPSSEQSGIVWPREMPPPKPIQMLATAVTHDEMEAALAYSCFPDTEAGRAAARRYFDRRYQRTVETSGEEPMFGLLSIEGAREQRKAAEDWSQPNPHNSFDRLGELKMPVLVLNGDDDLLIPTSRSYELLKRIDNAQLILYPQAGHSFLFQYAERVAKDVNTFLDENLASGHSKL
jgi:pimeloyl-ACP methyl ester carboxylesterase